MEAITIFLSASGVSFITYKIAPVIARMTIYKISYKIKKIFAYKKIFKAIDNKNYEEFLESLQTLKTVDYQFKKTKYHKLLNRLGLNEIIILNEKMFEVHQNPQRFIEMYHGKNINEEKYEDINERLEKLEESLLMNENECRLNL